MERKVQPSDKELIKSGCERALKRAKRRGGKLWFRHVSIEHVVKYIMSAPGSYIVDESYLVVYAIGSPWYASPDVIMLEEMFVLQLIAGGDFKEVPAFLERKAKEVGAVMIGVGTALTRFDTALASFYKQSGFSQEALILGKDVHVR